ncbi:MAG: Mobile element protein [Acidimicrobiaceae bacterium]|nr:Mobile element protein [Acidimicrobiaceae bacterium]
MLFVRTGRFRRAELSTQFVDVRTGQLLDVVPGRSGKEPKAWLDRKGGAWRDEVAYAAIDLSGPYRSVLEAMLPAATLVADPFHVVKLAHAKLDETRRRVQKRRVPGLAPRHSLARTPRPPEDHVTRSRPPGNPKRPLT